MGLELVAVDMDGTFLDSTSTFDRERFARVNDRLAAGGVRFAVASGNQYWQLKRYFDGFPETLYVAENGAVVGTDTEILRVRAMDRDDALSALETVTGHRDVHVLACGARSAYALSTIDPRMLALVRKYYVRTRVVTSWHEVDEDIVKLALICPPERTESLLDGFGRELPSGIVPVSSGHGSIDLIAAGVNKGTSLEWLCRRLDIDPANMVAFGDGGNDVEMLALAGTGVAMGNAPQAIRDRADTVIGSNDDAGVLAYLEKVLDQEPVLGKEPRAGERRTASR